MSMGAGRVAMTESSRCQEKPFLDKSGEDKEYEYGDTGSHTDRKGRPRTTDEAEGVEGPPISLQEGSRIASAKTLRR
ncbi:hypothetical protein SBA2_410066 [Acidobacteriia bacterium SbA2]|nr:hypothetical protein SBA2_410066 [Acidobacteriia bacterium SbA2]